MSSRAIDWYDRQTSTIAETYESLEFGAAHDWLLNLLPERRGLVLDVGAGSGRDAAALAAMGYEVVAVEPSASMLHELSRAEIEALARGHGAFVERCVESEDRLGRKDVRWIQLAVRLPDDGTGALPLLRHVVLQDAKSSTYKLALLRSVARIADGAARLVREEDVDRVRVPLGLVALY